MRSPRTLLLPTLTVALLLAGCAYPRVQSHYDHECQMVARQMVLDITDSGIINGRCSNRDCVAQVVVGAAVLATSVVVSGSIVVVGNVVYWFEKQRNCRNGPQIGPQTTEGAKQINGLAPFSLLRRAA